MLHLSRATTRAASRGRHHAAGFLGPLSPSPSPRRSGGHVSPFPQHTHTRAYATTLPNPKSIPAFPDAAELLQEQQTQTQTQTQAPTTPAYNHQETKTTADGLPLTYDPVVIQKYWSKRPQEMQRRWALFLSVTAPFITGLVKDFTQGSLFKNEAALARDLRIVLEKLGPTFVKLGQALSIRPDVIGPSATEELQKLQDAVPPFSNDIAMKIIEEELGRPWTEVFSEMSPEPIAAASLAQVYKGKLVSTGEYVAIKVQRPQMLETVSKDLYVMRRAVEVYQKYIVTRFTAQTTDYQELLQVFATGFYQELDFLNEAQSQIQMKQLLEGSSPGVYVPKVFSDLSTRRLLVSEWIDGIKLTQASQEDIRRLTKVAQECFLRQLLEWGVFHADPHPGNLLMMSDKSKGELAILDWGLTSNLAPEDMEVMVSALIHTANKDFGRLIDDLIALKVLPADTDRAKVLPVMTRVIGPYVFQGGGAKNLDLRSLTADLTRATLEIPFSIPSYFALIARALGILEGIALTGDENYRIVMESYPFVSRRLLTSDNSPKLQQALNDILYGSAQDGERLSFRRLSALLAYAMDVKANANDANVGTLFVDFDRVPDSTALRLNDTLSFLLSDNASPLRSLLVSEVTNAGDLLIRQQFRRTARLLPRPPLVPYPETLIDSLAPPLTLEEEIFLGSLSELGYTVLGLQDDTQTPTPTPPPTPAFSFPFPVPSFLPSPFSSSSSSSSLTPTQVIAWLTNTQATLNSEDVRDLTRLLQPGTPTSTQFLNFGGEIVRGLAGKARPRVERVVELGPSVLMGGGEKKEKKK